VKELERLLSGRDQRALLQGHILRDFDVVVQVSLNIPGLPKAMTGDRELVSLVLERICSASILTGSRPRILFFLDNGAGFAGMTGIKEWGPVVDVDVITRKGAIHRKSLTGGERPCLLCGMPAKDCARSRRHEFPDLRGAFQKLLTGALEELRG
jgi:phosphoribosyl-dephospho-CoA transferase